MELISLTVASSWWRTEVYLDSIDDDWSNRRFDIESTSVLIVPGKGSGSLYGSDARSTEVARLALLEGRLGMEKGFLKSHSLGPHPMLDLYSAYALTLSSDPDIESIHALCQHLNDSWTNRSAGVKLLEKWCSMRNPKSELSAGIALRPDELPMLARGWELARHLRTEDQVALSAQYYVGMWRTSSLLWTQTQVPDALEVVNARARFSAEPPGRELAGHDNVAQIAAELGPPSPMSSPLQQALRRALINAAESEENTKLDALMEAFSNASGINQVVVMSALDGLIKQTVHVIWVSSLTFKPGSRATRRLSWTRYAPAWTPISRDRQRNLDNATNLSIYWSFESFGARIQSS
ncbi:MAG: hypothetical protein ABSH52_23600 [Terriglobia bacterium]|jgi:hypothetical protein